MQDLLTVSCTQLNFFHLSFSFFIPNDLDFEPFVVHSIIASRDCIVLNVNQLWHQIGFGPDGGRRVVVLHADPDLVIHGQPGRLPDRRAHGDAHQLGRGPVAADPSRVRHAQLRNHSRLLQGPSRSFQSLFFSFLFF